MIRTCSWCGKQMGFKCPDCGATDITVEHAGQFDIGTCKACGYAFELSAAAPTNGICHECAAELSKPSGKAFEKPEASR